MGESRTELLQWINDLLQLNYTKIEQCGSGAVPCQILDTIYGDVQMSKVKFNARQQYEYVANFKVLQNTLKKHSIDKPIPVDRLINCKMQDNLEFLQWLKKYWDMNFPGGEYDAVARRKGAPGGEPVASAGAGRAPGAASARTSAAGGRASASSAVGAGAAAAARRGPGPRVASGPGPRAGPAASGTGVSDAALQQLTREMDDMKISVEGLEKERDFYFNKLRDIEIIIGARLESTDETITEVEKEILLQMQQILYSTEEGFEVPEGEEEQPLEDEEETF